MKKFSKEEIEKMPQNEVMFETCQGLAEVCEMLAKKYRQKEFATKAKQFRAMSKLFWED